MYRLAKILSMPAVALALGAAIPTAEAEVVNRKATVKPVIKNPARLAGKPRPTASGQTVSPTATGTKASFVAPRPTGVRPHQLRAPTRVTK
jgi:hypothetical protein